MKILAVSDEESPALWDYYVPGRLDGYDLILSCGDLKASYLSFLVTMGRARLLYVHGNHDESYESFPPEGCDDVDGHLVTYNGLRILGLGGCMRYRPGKHQYSEEQMARRIKKSSRALKKAGGVDIVIAHAPPKGYGDLNDPAHIGFECFLHLIDEFHPRYLLHGHVHPRYGNGLPREQTYNGTRIINVTGRCELEFPEGEYPPGGKGELVYISRHKEPKRYWGAENV